MLFQLLKLKMFRFYFLLKIEIELNFVSILCRQFRLQSERGQHPGVDVLHQVQDRVNSHQDRSHRSIGKHQKMRFHHHRYW